MTYADSEGVPAALTKTLVQSKNLRADDEFNPEMVVHHLGVIFLAHDSLQFLMKSVIENEISGVVSAYDYLHNSISKYLFVWYCKNYASAWIAKHWGSLVSSIVDQNLLLEGSATNPETNEKLRNCFYFLINSVSNNLIECPFLLWEFCSILSDYTSQDVFQFLCINFLAAAIEDPVGYYLLHSRPDARVGREALRTFSLLGQMIRDLGNKKTNLAGALTVDEAEASRWMRGVESWCAGEPATLSEMPITISWKTERDSIMFITDYIFANKIIIDGELRRMGSVMHNITFSFTELMSTLKPPDVMPDWESERVSSPFFDRRVNAGVGVVTPSHINEDVSKSGKKLGKEDKGLFRSIKRK
jgi:hypothetical protein